MSIRKILLRCRLAILFSFSLRNKKPVFDFQQLLEDRKNIQQLLAMANKPAKVTLQHQAEI